MAKQIEYKLGFSAYDGPNRFYATAVSDSGELIDQVGFETRGEAELFIAEMNDTPEWQEYCRQAVAE